MCPEMGIGKFPNVKTDAIYLDRENLDVKLYRSAADTLKLDDNLALAAGKTVDGTDISDHVADLDAHVKHFHEILRTGQYWFYCAALTGTFQLTANRLYAVPLVVPRDLTIDRLAVNVTVGDSGKKARLGVYNNGTNLYPGTLVKDFGEISVASTGVVAASAEQSLTKGIYHLAIVSDGAPTIRRAQYNDVFLNVLGILSTNFVSNRQAWIVTQTYGALPDPFTAGGSTQAQCSCPIPRIKSID